MGNTQSEVTAGAKKQADFDPNVNKIYSLLDLKKGGILVAIMREAFRTRDFSKVDDKIRDLVTPFLYNEGRGKMIPISRIIRMRNKERPPSKRLPSSGPEDGEDDDYSSQQPKSPASWLSGISCWRKTSAKVESIEEGNDSGTTVKSPEKEVMKEVCWKLSERGAVGETALHMCLLLSTIVHLELCRRLVKMFPKLVNDIHISDEYYGEGPLHMAVVNEDPSMVKFLLDHGALVHERSIGNFFCADDQKDGRVDNIKHEYFDLPVETNYAGHVYWGEYSLSFAACLEMDDCYRLLLAKGADDDLGDSNGNTVIHMCVIVDKMSQFDLAYELGADISIKNRQGLTALALAAKLTRSQMFFHIINLLRDVYWQFTDIAFAAYPLDEIDSIDVNTGLVNTTSAITVIAFGEELGHLDLMSGVIVDILNKKWETFARKEFFRKIKIFFVYFVITLFAFILRPAPAIHPDFGSDDWISNCTKMGAIPKPKSSIPVVPNFKLHESVCFQDPNCQSVKRFRIRPPRDVGVAVSNDTALKQYCNNDECYLLKYKEPLEIVRGLLDTMTFAGALLYVFSFSLEAKRLGIPMFIQTWKAVPGRVMFGISCLLILSCLPFRVFCMPRIEDRLIAMAMFLTPMHFLFFCRGFKAVGPFVIMIYKMIVSDLLCFVLIYMIFVFGFGQAFFVIFRSHKKVEGGSDNIFFSGVIDSTMTMFLMSLAQFEDVYGEFDNTDHAFLAKFLFLVYMIVVAVLLVNMLIAMMGHTYEDIASRPNEWLRQWARIVLIVERGLVKEQRLLFQTKYSEVRNGKKVFISRWQTTPEERQEIESLKELAAENKANRTKRKNARKKS
jgi:ankyrin repeat protein